MSGGKIQGNREPDKEISTNELLRESREKLARTSETLSRHKNLSTGQIDEISNLSKPSPEHERPASSKGERDPYGIAPGRKSPFKA